MELCPSYPVRSARTLLRPLGPDDVDDLHAYRSLPEVCRFVPFEPMAKQDIAERITGVWARRSLDAEGQALALGVELLESGRLIGDILLRWHSAEHRSGEIGYVFNPQVAGQGLATESVHQLLHLAFDALGLRRVVARVDARNDRSAAMARRLGFRLEAHLIENEFFKGEWSDELDFALLAAEWSTRHEPSGCPNFAP